MKSLSHSPGGVPCLKSSSHPASCDLSSSFSTTCPLQAMGPTAHLTAVTRSFPWLADVPELVSELVSFFEARNSHVGPRAGASIGPSGLDLSANHDEKLLTDSSLGFLLGESIDRQ